jgi:transitional endoplasmic reticulum ATPase
MHPHERWTTRRYLANMLKSSRFARPPLGDSDIVNWIENHSRLLGLPKLAPEALSSIRWGTTEAPISPARWKSWRVAAIGTAREPTPNPSPLQKRIDWLARVCSLTEQQSRILGLLARATQTPQVRALIEAVGDGFQSPDDFDLHQFLETRSERGELSSRGRLAELGLIDARDGPRLSHVVRRLLSLPRLESRRIGDLLLGEPARASLAWRDFEHLGGLRDLAARVVAAAGSPRRATRRGANLLFYGLPGTGKTEFAKTLGAHLGFSVQFCGEAGEENAEPDRRERIAALLIANAIGAVARKTIVVVDEADDLLAGFGDDDVAERRGSKIFINRLIERAAAPTIWITNDAHRLGPAIIRRMNLALRFSKPTLSVRKAMVARIAKGADFQLEESALVELARTPAPPALIENAILSATHIRGSAADARNILETSLRALGGPGRQRAPTPIPFDPTLSLADVDLARLADQVAKSGTRALSFCLSGPPGSGKSAYARHLAERLDLDILEKRFSELSSMWLGESEKAIAAAFEEAADLRAFLILDEVDSLLRDRGAASHSWEITQVNEMLTQMESHSYPFACTTNAPELVDAAAARRFLFKVLFLPMTAHQIAEAYRRAFGADAPAFLLKLSNLTPGDFAIVARKATALDERDSRILAQWLEFEARTKPDTVQRKIGF